MLGHGAARASGFRDVLDEADHGPPTVTVELVVVAGLDAVKLGDSLSLGRRDGVLGDGGLEVVSQVGDEAHTVV